MTGGFLYGYWVPFFWGLAVLASFLGWGSAIQRAASLPETDWGLRCGWGMAFTAVLGGFLACLSMAGRPVLITMVAAGALLALLLCADGLPPIFKSRGSMLGALGFLALIVLVYAPRVDIRWSNACDDDLAYWVFAKRLLDSGTLIEPFSQRRLAAFVGHSLLQAVVWAFGSQKNLHLVDYGLSVVVLAGMVFGCCRKARASIGWACLIAGFAILVPVPRINSMSQVTGVVLFFALFRTLQNSIQKAPRWQDGMIAAIVVAATCSLRATYIPVVAAFCAIGLLFANPWPLRRRIPHFAGLGLAATFFLLPWMWLLHRSSGTWIYPIMHGNEQPGTAMYSFHMTPGELEIGRAS